MPTNDENHGEPATQGMPELPVLPDGRFEGREAFRERVRDALACAAREGWREIILSDADFHDWPLGERAVIESLNAWAKTGRKLVMLAKNYDAVTRGHPRFVTWRRTWSHILECRRCATADALEIPSALWASGWVMHRLDPERNTGVCTVIPERRLALRETLEEWLRQSSAGFSVTTLGL
jgi:hypothetical protein